MDNLNPLIVFFKAKLSFGNGQFIEYEGMTENEGIEINGEYHSNYPKDKGTFELNKR